MTRSNPRARALAIFLGAAMPFAVACDRDDDTTIDAEELRESRKKQRRARDAGSSGDSHERAAGSTRSVGSSGGLAPAPPLPELPPAGPLVRTEPPPDLNAPLGVDVTASGLASRVIKRGAGTVHPTTSDEVVVHYSGWTLDGNLFDSSVPRGKPATFGVTQVIAGWTEGLQLMVEGERRRLWIPAELAYGVTPKRAGAPAGKLVFEVELLAIVRGPEVPPDLTSPPADATRTPSGLVYRALRRGGATARPTATSKVEVHYSGWTLDGHMFDSSVRRGKPAKFPVDGVIKGWTEVLQLMSPGDAFRVWIPPELAYGTTPKRAGAPAGMLVFDIELIAVE